MKKKYQRWIKDYLFSRDGRVTGECETACKLMRAVFPELILQGGYVHTALGLDTHFWLMTPAGELVDPTASQFDDLRREDYENAGTTDPLALLERFFVRKETIDDGEVANEQTVRGLPLA